MKNFLKTDIKYVVTFIGLIILLIIPTIKPVFIVAFGEEINLEVTGYDPTDPFRGDYVNIGYSESFIPIELFDDTIDSSEYGENLRKEQLYVSLVKSGEYYQVKEVSLEKPDGLYLKAEFEWLQYDWENNRDVVTGMFVHFNLDRFYVEENSGYELEKQVREGKAYSVLKVYNGNAVLVDVKLK